MVFMVRLTSLNVGGLTTPVAVPSGTFAASFDT
jgi:hypothetical protein